MSSIGANASSVSSVSATGDSWWRVVALFFGFMAMAIGAWTGTLDWHRASPSGHVRLVRSLLDLLPGVWHLVSVHGLALTVHSTLNRQELK